MSKKINVRDIKNRQKLLKTEFKHNFLRFKAISSMLFPVFVSTEKWKSFI